MKKRIAAAAVIVIFTMALGESAWAGRVKNRQFKQGKRISQGVKSDELTKRETTSLVKQQRRIQHSKKRAWSSPVFPPIIDWSKFQN